MEQTKILADAIIKGIQEKKGQNITIIDLSNIEGAIARYFIVCQGNTPTQVEAITESVGDIVREELDEKPARTIGLELAQWVAIDFTDIIVHIFVPDMRAYYSIESLWQDAVQTQIPDLD